MRTEFTCSVCKETKIHEEEHTTGYGLDKDNNKICFACCGIKDAEEMDKTGKATLYLTKGSDSIWYVSNWPGTLKIRVQYQRKGHHNIAGNRYDVWFTFNDSTWHGVQYGEMTQICHCRRTKHAA